MATRALNAALTEALEDGVDYDDLMNVRMDDGGQVSLLREHHAHERALAERAGDAALRKLKPSVRRRSMCRLARRWG